MIYVASQYAADAALYGYNMKHARILWDNKLAGATFTADSEREGFDAVRAQSPDTVSWWWPETAGALTMTLAAETTLDCLCIAAHSIGTEGVGVLVEGLVDAVWTTLHATIEPADDEAIMVLFRSVAVTALRITLDASARVGVVYAGPALTMPQMVYSGAPVLRLTYATEFDTNRSQTGQFMGRSIVASSRPIRVAWRHLREAWARSHLKGFIMAAKTSPFFLGIRPQGYAEDVGYVLASGDIIPQRMGIRDYVEIEVSGEAHVEPTL